MIIQPVVTQNTGYNRALRRFSRTILLVTYLPTIVSVDAYLNGSPTAQLNAAAHACALARLGAPAAGGLPAATCAARLR